LVKGRIGCTGYVGAPMSLDIPNITPIHTCDRVRNCSAAVI